MSQAYSNPKRASDPHALPNVEVFYIGTTRVWRETLECQFCTDWATEQTSHREHIGWYWQACSPGCLPDSDPIGPFATEAEALEDAQEGSEDDD